MKIHIEAVIHMHHHDDQRLEKIEQKIDVLLAQGAQIIMANQEILDLVTRIDVATNKVAAKLQALADQISTGMSAAEVAAVKAALGQEVADLEALGADPADPVPTP